MSATRDTDDTERRSDIELFAHLEEEYEGDELGRVFRAVRQSLEREEANS